MATDKLPLIAAGDRDVTGNAREQSTFFEGGQDLTYVKGYSDVRRARASAKAGEAKPPMPKVRLHWARAQTPGGKPDGQDIAWHRAQGYTYAPKDMSSLGMAAPDSGQWDEAAGVWRLGDTVLMQCSRDIAARNENVLRRATEERSSADATASHLHSEGTKVGRALGQDMLTESKVEKDLIVR